MEEIKSYESNRTGLNQEDSTYRVSYGTSGWPSLAKLVQIFSAEFPFRVLTMAEGYLCRSGSENRGRPHVNYIFVQCHKSARHVP